MAESFVPVSRGPVPFGASLRRGVQIRAAREDEAAELSALAVSSKGHWGYAADFLEACRAELAVSALDIRQDEVWIAEDPGGRPGGFVHGVAVDGVLEILCLFVSPAHIGMGYGRRLWQTAEWRATVLGCSTLALDSDPYAVGFYRRMGMVVAGEVPSGSIPGRMLPRMVKHLAA